MRNSGASLWLAAVLVLFAAWVLWKVQGAWVWPSDTAALVEGRPITMAELNQVLGWGLYGQVSPEKGDPAPEAVPFLVLDKLIEERLVLAEAGRRNIALDEREFNVEVLSSPDLSPAQAENLRRNLIRQARLHKISAQIMTDERRLSAAGWRAFWRAWPKKKPTRYLVRVLFLPSSPEAPNLPGSARGNLDQLARRLRLDGLPTILSTAVWLRSDRLDSELTATLENAWAAQKPSPPFRQEGSWAVYEVLDLDRKTAAVAELKAARAAYELAAGEEAFQTWLFARRAAADIRINPNLSQPRE